MVSSGVALLAGFVFAGIWGCPSPKKIQALTYKLLGIAVVALGAGVNIEVAWRWGLQGLVYSAIGILLSLGVGKLLTRWLDVERTTAILISAGTAICGGSAIAALAPVIQAECQQISVALGTVFTLNMVALFLFPWVGHLLHLSQTDFGLWCALAIHDTSSVVGAAMSYGPQALKVATAVKLARTLWIIPVSFLFGLVFFKSTPAVSRPIQRKYPWFILGFIVMAIVMNTWVQLHPLAHFIEFSGKRLLVMTLFFVGSQLSFQTIKSVGPKPMLYGVLLWAFLAVGCLVGLRVVPAHFNDGTSLGCFPQSGLQKS